MVVRRHLIVRGRVQGVWYRGSCAERAQAAGVNGWARNLPDGRVEIVVEGEPDAVEELEQWCHEGPPYARVVGVEAWDEEAQGLTGFDTY